MFTRFLSTALSLAVITVATSGCSKSSEPANSDDAPTTPVTLANEVCPMMGSKVDPAVTVEWNGKTIGFCCADCIPGFMALSDEEKQTKLAEAATGDADAEMQDNPAGDDQAT